MKECYTYYRQLREELDRWLSQSVRMDIPGPNKGGEDEANYSLSWFPHYLVTASDAIAKRFQSLLSDLDNWVKTDCLHGYEPEAEAHHGTEPFLLFLPRYLGLFPEDETAKRILADAAHHIGNWVEEIPAWYDYDKDCFYGYYIGTRVVGQDPRFAYELAEHFRFIHIALAAYRVLGEERYLQWALRYGRCRAQRILDAGDGPMPLLWETGGKGLREGDLTTREQISMSASGHHIKGDPLAGIENMLASGAIYALGDLFLLSGEDIFRQAARKIAAPLVDELLDPYCDPGSAAVGYYRWTFDDDSLDEQILKVLEKMPPDTDAKLAMIFPQEYHRRETGVGKRNDMVYWGLWDEDGSAVPIREPSTAALTLAYQMTGELGFAKRALKSASIRLMMARRVLRGGREHSDMGGAICSVAAGHGRNWGHGAVTGCYGPLLLGTRIIQSKLTSLIEVKDGSQIARLPAEVISLVIPPVGKKGEVLFCNRGGETVAFSWQCSKTEETEWRQIKLLPNESQRFLIE